MGGQISCYHNRAVAQQHARRSFVPPGLDKLYFFVVLASARGDNRSLESMPIAMADKFDPYREALIVEVQTQWPEEYDDWEPSERARVEKLLHANPEKAAHLEYVRTHTGFCRRIVVSPEDIQRVTA